MSDVAGVRAGGRRRRATSPALGARAHGGGLRRVYADEADRTAGGPPSGRPQLAACLASLRPGDTLVVASLDQLGRSQRELFALVDDVRRRGAGFRSLRERLDTTAPGGEAIFRAFAGLADFGRATISAGTSDGLAAARASGQAARPAAGADGGAAPRGPRAAAAARAHDLVGRAGARRQPVHDLQVPAGAGPRARPRTSRPTRPGPAAGRW